jgi:hypothetical protein
LIDVESPEVAEYIFRAVSVIRWQSPLSKTLSDADQHVLSHGATAMRDTEGRFKVEWEWLSYDGQGSK